MASEKKSKVWYILSIIVILCLLVGAIFSYNLYQEYRAEQEISQAVSRARTNHAKGELVKALQELSEVLKKYPENKSASSCLAVQLRNQLIAEGLTRIQNNKICLKKQLPVLAVVDITVDNAELIRDHGTRFNGEHLALLLLDEINGERFQRVTRSKLHTALTELRFQSSDLFEKTNAIKLGKYVGAELIISGSVYYDGNVFTLYCVLFETFSGKIKQTAMVYGNDPSDIQYMIKEAALILEMSPKMKTEYLKKKALLSAVPEADLLSSSMNLLKKYKRKCAAWIVPTVKAAEKRYQEIYTPTKMMLESLKNNCSDAQAKAVQCNLALDKLSGFYMTEEYKLLTAKYKARLAELRSSIEEYRKKIRFKLPCKGFNWFVPGLNIQMVHISGNKESSSFWIAAHETGLKAFLQYLNSGKKTIGLDIHDRDCPIAFENGKYVLRGNKLGRSLQQPVVELNWYGAMAFCNWLTERERRAGRLPEGYIYRLPTSKEWESACIGNVSEKHTWCSENSDNVTHDIGTKMANDRGIYDMTGNVEEWCTPSSTLQLPADISITKGGSWVDELNKCRNNKRSFQNTSSTANNIGFRVVLAPVLRI